MTYTQNIPDAPNNPSQDQPLMKANTNAIFTYVATDHIPFNVPNAGNHDIIKQPPQAGDPAAVAGKGQTYTKVVTGDEQLFYRSGAGVISQLTNAIGTLAAANGYSYLPGGMIIQWGRDTFPGSTTAFNVNFPTACFGVLTTTESAAGSTGVCAVIIRTLAVNQFTWTQRVSSSTTNFTGFFWVAIGN